MTGAIYGEGYRDLQRGALAYIQATSVGGTHPALIEAMGAGNLVLAFGTPENVEVTAGNVYTVPVKLSDTSPLVTTCASVDFPAPAAAPALA